MTSPKLDRYLNVDEVESAILGLAAEYPQLARRITLPHQTFEGRTSHALIIGEGSDPVLLLIEQQRRPCVLFTACAHAREWGGAEICLSFAADLLEAYRTHAGLKYGNGVYDKETVQRIIDELYVVVLPCVNPDGRHFSQTYTEAPIETRDAREMWRKNRRVFNGAIGVDINRNHAFLWDYKRYFSPQANSTVASDVESDDAFHGQAQESEPETRNIHWLLDRLDKRSPPVWPWFPDTLAPHWYVDIHSFSNSVLYVWGDDENQTTNPFMDFRSSRWDGIRGTSCSQSTPSPAGCGYQEFIDRTDEMAARDGAATVAEAISKARGMAYDDIQAFNLKVPLSNGKFPYPTSGSASDYAYSRHIVSSAVKAHSLVVEFGRLYLPHDLPRSFHPEWPEMAEIVKEVSSGMLALCASALTRPNPFLLGPHQRPWTWPWEIWVDRIRKMPDVFRAVSREAIRTVAAAIEKGISGTRR
ncbi:M14 family zinc carboxypeptidase [Streptomyces mirabilis]|uniref:M14 family zinc carboxypeptidase n=1 Tax=Streptomyces mirabilis TaxID=68239 RepID=UPI0036B45214